MCHSKLLRIILIPVLLAALTSFIPTGPVSAQGVDSKKAKAEQAWQTLADSAQERLKATEGDTSIVRDIVQELTDFAERYPRRSRLLSHCLMQPHWPPV